MNDTPGAQSPVYLIACGKRKRPEPEIAAYLYTGALFTSALVYAVRRVPPTARLDERVFVLSAKHGLLPLTRIVAPYDETLNRMDAAARRRWGARVAAELERRFGTPVEGGGVWPPMGGRHFVILAGRAYRDAITPAIEQSQSTWEAPMAGLGIGQQLAWLKAQRGAAGGPGGVPA